MVGWQETQGKDAVKAAMYGSIAASFVVEQVGVPRLSVPTTTSTTTNCSRRHETWNEGPSPLDRLYELGLRCNPQDTLI
jgi:hypothetical protein